MENEEGGGKMAEVKKRKGYGKKIIRWLIVAALVFGIGGRMAETETSIKDMEEDPVAALYKMLPSTSGKILVRIEEEGSEHSKLIIRDYRRTLDTITIVDDEGEIDIDARKLANYIILDEKDMAQHLDSLRYCLAMAKQNPSSTGRAIVYGAEGFYIVDCDSYWLDQGANLTFYKDNTQVTKAVKGDYALCLEPTDEVRVEAEDCDLESIFR